MSNSIRKNKIRNAVRLVALCACLACTLLFEFVEFSWFKSDFRNQTLTLALSQLSGALATCILLSYLQIKVFHKIERWYCFLPCLLIALNNLQWHALLQGKMHLDDPTAVDFLLFSLYCATTGLFEELLFRGLLLGLLFSRFPDNKQGFLWAFVLSSLLFGLAHLFNGFSFGSLLQVGYSILTGGLFAFCFIKTKNILLSATTHAVYNFCGLLFDSQYLGSGVVFDLGTALCMLVVGVAVGIWVLCEILTYPEKERTRLYSLVLPK